MLSEKITFSSLLYEIFISKSSLESWEYIINSSSPCLESTSLCTTIYSLLNVNYFFSHFTLCNRNKLLFYCLKKFWISFFVSSTPINYYNSYVVVKCKFFRYIRWLLNHFGEKKKYNDRFICYETFCQLFMKILTSWRRHSLYESNVTRYRKKTKFLHLHIIIYTWCW